MKLLSPNEVTKHGYICVCTETNKYRTHKSIQEVSNICSKETARILEDKGEVRIECEKCFNN